MAALIIIAAATFINRSGNTLAAVRREEIVAGAATK